MTQALVERYADRLHGVLSCYDRILITGTLPRACYAEGMTGFLYGKGVRIFDYARFAEPLRDAIRTRAQELAASAGIEIEHISKAHIRKEDVVAKVLERRGEEPGLVHIISAMEGCQSYRPWHDKGTGKTFLKPDVGKCLHYYFYFMDPIVGLCHLRVPTWCPFKLQFYCNGHGWLAQKLKAKRIEFTLADNALIRIDDFERAQKLADALKPEQLHRILDRYARQCCPVHKTFEQRYRWSILQAEYSTDLLFRSKETLAPLYEELSRQAVLSVKAEQVATFLGKKITAQLAQEIGNRFATRIEGTCIKHRLGKAQVKMYDKFGRVLRIETTINDVAFFKHHRKVEHREGPSTRELAALKKSIYSLIDLREILLGCNRRYLEFLSALDDHSAGQRALERLTEERRAGDRPIKGLNFFKRTEQQLLRTLQRPEFNIHGLRRADLIALLPDLSPAALSRQLKRFLSIGVIKRVSGTYRYYLTRLGRAAIAAACSLTQFHIVPALAAAK
ncbi:MAG: MarR family transcriptional regulator [Gammaproteobacteria bacterium]